MTNFIRPLANYLEDRRLVAGCFQPLIYDRNNSCESIATIILDNPTIPDFLQWSFDQRAVFEEQYLNYHKVIMSGEDKESYRYSIFNQVFFQHYYSIHKRSITHFLHPYTFFYKCYPGCTRSFCTSEGKIMPCERTETNNIFIIGNSEDGVNPDFSIRLTELFRLLGDCGNCVAKRICPKCPAMISYRHNNGHDTVDLLAFQIECQEIIEQLPIRLSRYASLMEANPNAIDNFFNGNLSEYENADKWLREIKFCYPKNDPNDYELTLEELS